jgi:hypothetical protein
MCADAGESKGSKIGWGALMDRRKGLYTRQRSSRLLRNTSMPMSMSQQKQGEENRFQKGNGLIGGLSLVDLHGFNEKPTSWDK